MPTSDVGEYWPFRQTVNLIVEQQNFEAHVAAQHVNRVVAADGKRVAVAGGHPNIQVGPGDLHARSDGGRAAMNRVESESVHVIRKAAGAANARNEHELLARDAEVRENSLHRGQNRVVAAARTPANFLVGLEIFSGVNRQRGRGHFQFSQ